MSINELLISELTKVKGIGDLYEERVLTESPEQEHTENIVLDRNSVIDYLYKSGYELNETNYHMAEQMLKSLKQSELNVMMMTAGKEHERKYQIINHLEDLSEEELKSLTNIAILKLLNEIKNSSNASTYQYVVETLTDGIDGVTDVFKIQEILNRYSNDGYRLKTVFANEIGKNSLSIGGIGTNSTVGQIIMVFEKTVSYN